MDIETSTATQQIRHPDYKTHRFQKPGSGWCGPTVLQMMLLKAGIEKSQEEIANATLSDGKPLYDPAWGSSHKRINEYLGMHFDIHGIEANSSLDRIAELLEKGCEVMVNIMGIDLTDEGDVDKGGHYVRVESYDKKTEIIKIFDPSNGTRPDGKQGVYELNAKDEFEPYWWDYATLADEKNKMPTEHWLAYADPSSAKTTGTIQ